MASAMRAEGQTVAAAKVCRWLGVPRSCAYAPPRVKTPRRPRMRSEALPEGFLTALIYALIQVYPTFGVRMIWSQVRFTLGFRVNRKRVARLMRKEGWTVTKRRKGGRPRVTVKTSVAAHPDERWATDTALVHCGRDGWCACPGDRLLHAGDSRVGAVGLLARTHGRAGPGVGAHPPLRVHAGAPPGLILRHDNGLVFGSRGYIATAGDYGLTQEYITPYTPEENGLCERFIRTIKEECVWQHRFGSLDDARRVLGRWIAWYNAERPHSALGYKAPEQRRATPASIATAA